MNLHPMIVHFPIALLMVGFAFATLAVFCKKCCASKNSSECSTQTSTVQKTAYWLLLLGALSASVGVVSGLVFTSPMTAGPLAELYNTHLLLAISTMTVSLITAGVYTYYIFKAQTKQILTIGYSLYLLCATLVAVTGHFGGSMVYFLK